MDFAFFAVNFGYSKTDYEALTIAEKAFIYKAYEDMVVSQSTILCNAVTVAVANALRKKNKRPHKLWKKRRTAVVDKDVMKHTIKDVLEIEKKSGKAWVDLIYKANGMRRPGGEKAG